jgi:hypothetical protein
MFSIFVGLKSFKAVLVMEECWGLDAMYFSSKYKDLLCYAWAQFVMNQTEHPCQCPKVTDRKSLKENPVQRQQKAS